MLECRQASSKISEYQNVLHAPKDIANLRLLLQAALSVQGSQRSIYLIVRQ